MVLAPLIDACLNLNTSTSGGLGVCVCGMGGGGGEKYVACYCGRGARAKGGMDLWMCEVNGRER